MQIRPDIFPWIVFKTLHSARTTNSCFQLRSPRVLSQYPDAGEDPPLVTSYVIGPTLHYWTVINRQANQRRGSRSQLGRGHAHPSSLLAQLPLCLRSGRALGAVKEQGFEKFLGFPWSHLHPSCFPQLSTSVGVWLPPSVPSAPSTPFF